MKKRLPFLVSLLLSWLLSICQTKTDSVLNAKINYLEKKVEQISTTAEALNKNSQDNLSQSNNILTYAGFGLAILAIFITLYGFGVGFITYKHSKEVKTIENDVKRIRKKIEARKKEIDLIYESLLEKNTILEDKIERANKDSETILNNINTLKNKFEADTRNIITIIPLYYDAFEKLNAGKIARAKPLFERILELNRDFYNARCKLAMCFSSENKNDEGIKALDDLITSNNAPAEVYSTYGVILGRMGHYEKSKQAFLKALEKDSQNYSTHTHLGYVYLYMNNITEAVNKFKDSIKIKPNSGSFSGLVKSHFLNGGDVDNCAYLDTALEVTRFEISQDMKYPYPWMALAFLEMCANNPNCIISLEKVFEISTNIGILNEQLKEYELVANKPTSLIHLPRCIEILNSRIKEIYRLSTLTI